jgi:D-xylose transport system ATP-binding protein
MFLESKKAINKINKYFKDFNTNVANLSGGQKQSIAIARAVYFNAKVIIMDEPTAALGPAETSVVRDIIKKLKENGISIFLISHDINDLFDLSDKIAVLKNGKLIGVKEKLNSNKDEILEMIITGK